MPKCPWCGLASDLVYRGVTELELTARPGISAEAVWEQVGQILASVNSKKGKGRKIAEIAAILNTDLAGATWFCELRSKSKHSIGLPDSSFKN